MVGNNISHVPSKHQLKKEKKAARKNRKSKKQDIRNQNDTFISDKSNTVEENNGVLESGKIFCIFFELLLYINF